MYRTNLNQQSAFDMAVSAAQGDPLFITGGDGFN